MPTKLGIHGGEWFYHETRGETRREHSLNFQCESTMVLYILPDHTLFSLFLKISTCFLNTPGFHLCQGLSFSPANNSDLKSSMWYIHEGRWEKAECYSLLQLCICILWNISTGTNMIFVFDNKLTSLFSYTYFFFR